MGIFRSEDMTLYQITIPKDDYWEIFNQLGNINLCHFINLNKGDQQFNLPFSKTIKSTEETERRINFLIKECLNLKMKMNKPKNIQNFLELLQTVRSEKKKASNLLFEEIDIDIKEKEAFVLEQVDKIKEMNENYLTLLDYEKVLENVKILLPHLLKGNVRASMGGGAHFSEEAQRQVYSINLDQQNQNVDDPLMQQEVNISTVAGTIELEEQIRMKKLIFRATREKALTYFKEYISPATPTQKERKKAVYIVVFQEGVHVRDRIVKICDSFMGQRFDLPAQGGLDIKLQEVKKSIADSKQLMLTSRRQLKNYLTQINSISGAENQDEQVSALHVYKWFVVKEKTLYNSLNCTMQGQSSYIGYFWVPKEDEEKVYEVLKDYPTTDCQKYTNHRIIPPTYIKTNEFTAAFQEIVNTYGMPSYKEANPGIFTIVSFPFLFGVMFGDLGHGFLLWLAGVILIFTAPYMKDTPYETVAMVRYLIMLMGFFATYNGLIYNEIFAMQVEFFRSCWSQDAYSINATDPYSITAFHKLHDDCVYEIGVDPRWGQASNYLVFTNNMKEKFAVILGVFHMSIGIFVKGINNLYFKQYVDFFFEFIPQIALLWVLFGWMDTLIVAKWVYPFVLDWETPQEYDDVSMAPGVITLMINMFLKRMTPPPEYDMISVIPNQEVVSQVCLLTAIVTVPVMLCVKPCYLGKCKKHPHVEEHNKVEHEVEGNELEEVPDKKKNKEVYDQITEIMAGLNEDDGHHKFGELMIHQLIETIEFSLGTISNTASYLRLWALSLAHCKLSEVILVQIMKNQIFVGLGFAMDSDSPGAVAFCMFVLQLGWWSATIAIIMIMDTMEAFLHTLRLHWVEFQNKFYKGQGYKYVPYSFQVVLKQEMIKG